MLFLFLLIIAGFIVLIAACTFGQSRRSPVSANRLVDYGVGLLVLVTACFLPVFLLIWGVHSYVIPIPMASDAVSRFDLDPAKFNEELGDIPREHREDLQKRGVPEDEIRGIQEMLWTGWPIIVVATLLLLLIGIQALAHSHLALLRDVEGDDSCPPGGANSYVGVRTLDSQWENQTDVRYGEEREARSHSSWRCGNSSYHELHQRGGLYERIAVARDDIARDILSSIAERGPAHVIERLAEVLHEPGHHEIEESASEFPEHDDEVYEERGYVLIWNARRRYVSLAYAVESDALVTS
jgi:hypothetical protein